MARADHERRRSWCCRGRRRGAGVGGEEPVLSRSRAAGLGGARGPASVGQFAERPRAAGLSAPARGWHRRPPRRSRCRDRRGVGGLHRAPRRTSRRGGRAAGGRRRPGQREPCVTAETAALGGGESLWPGAAAASVSRGEVVLLLLLAGGSGRGLGLLLGAGDGGLGLGLGGFSWKEVVGHWKAQSTCFCWAPGGRSGEAAALDAESGAGFGVCG